MIKKILIKNNLISKTNKSNNKTIVCIGGGTGLFSLLSGLRDRVENRNVIKAIVTTLDNGGSSGRLITQYGVLPPGDIRNCLVALSEEPKVVSDLFQYRFDKKLDNHNFGNLFLTALSDVTGSFDQAIKEASRILRVRGEVVPVSLEHNTLFAELEDGRIIEGETNIDTTPDKKIKRLFLKKIGNANSRSIEVLEKADIIIFGPGDFYTSIIPNLLFPEVKNAIKKNKKAKKVLVSAVMSKPGETDDFTVSKFKEEIEKYLDSKLTHIISNDHIPATSSLKEYSKENKYPIPIDEEKIKGCKLIKGNFIDESKIVRHSPNKLSKAVMNLL